EAALLLGKRLVVQAGWTDLHDLTLPESVRRRVLLTDFVAHDWLFPHAEAVIHPGGIGVTARALPHRLPMLVQPLRQGQYFQAAHLRQVGVGQAMDPRKLTAKGVARMLAERVLVPPARHAAQEKAQQLRSEDGVATACRLIEQLLRERGR